MTFFQSVRLLGYDRNVARLCNFKYHKITKDLEREFWSDQTKKRYLKHKMMNETVERIT